MGSLKPLIPPATAESIVAKKGTTTTNGAGDGSTVVDTGLTEANDYWNDMTLLILSGASDGQSRDITDFAGGTLTVSPVFSNQILSGVRYLILPIKPSAAEVEDLKGTGFIKDTDSLVDISHEAGAKGTDNISDHLGYEGATSLATKLTIARAGFLDNIDNVNLATIDDISSLGATEIGHLDADISEVVQQIALTGHPADSIGKILFDFYNTRLTAARCGYLANIDNANLATIADISSLTATEIGYLANIDNANLSTIADISSLTAAEIAHLDGDISSRAPSGEYDTEMARITADVATEAKQDVIDGYHDVPGEDAATDTQMRDVVGKKSDTIAGTSIVSISKQVKAKTDNIPASPAPSGEYDTELDANMSTRAPANEYDTEMGYITEAVATEAKQDTIAGYHDAADVDGAFNVKTRDVIGNKTDTIGGTSLVAISKQIKAKTDNLPAANVDVSGNITWVTLTHTTNEGDISALFSTALTGAARRRYAVFVDLTGCEADGAAWTKCTVRVKIGFGVGDAYRTVDLKEIAKTDCAAAKEPGVNIDVPATAKNVQITLQFDVALAANATIYYSYVKEVLE